MGLEINGSGKVVDKKQRKFSFLSWNIGYAGLGKEMDFFYEGGKQVRPQKGKHFEYIEGNKKIIQAQNTVDFIFLQEIDIHSKRSWYSNEVESLTQILPNFFNVFTPNYDCRFVPVPLLNPMGRVLSGMVNFLQIKPDDVKVHYFDQFFSWPKRLFYLKYCFVMMRFKLENDKDLVIFNIHNSAYDIAKTSRKKEFAILSSIMEKEYGLGHYVVAGGDWNMNPRNFNSSSIISGDKVFKSDKIESDFLLDWQFAFDSGEPSNRNVNIPYQKGVTETTVLDFFIVSPNIEVQEVKTLNLNFEYSDHNPVKLSIRLK